MRDQAGARHSQEIGSHTLWRPMTPRGSRLLWAVILGGSAAKVVTAFVTVGLAYDIDSFRVVSEALQGDQPLALYLDVNAEAVRWPYPPGYFPWILGADRLSGWLGLPFHGVVQVAPIIADAVLAWVVQAYLGDRGADERRRLGAAALIAFGPSFLFVSGYEGQLDSVALAPAAAALLIWSRLPSGRRAPAAGFLIGLGVALKTFPLLVVLALLPRVRGGREGAVLVGTAIAVPLVLLSPWLVAEMQATLDALRYNGLPGVGGISLLVQPGLADYWLRGTPVELSALTKALIEARAPITAAGLGVMVAILLRRRPDPATGALMVYLGIFVFGLNFGPRYLLWALPFALMAGWLREVAVLQAVTVVAAAVLVAAPFEDGWIPVVFVFIMLSLLAAFAVWLGALAKGDRPAHPPEPDSGETLAAP